MLKRGTISFNSEDIPFEDFLDEDEQQQVIRVYGKWGLELNRKYTSIFSMISIGFLLRWYIYFLLMLKEEEAKMNLKIFKVRKAPWRLNV